MSDCTTIEFNPQTGEFFKLRQIRTQVDPSPLAGMLAGPLPYRPVPMLAPGDYVVINPSGQVILVHEFKAIPFQTAIMVTDKGRADGKPVILPEFYSSGNSPSLRSDAVELTFTPQEGQWLWLVLEPHAGRSSMVSQCKETGKLYRTGVPNIYANCTLCTGAAALPEYVDIWRCGLQYYLESWLSAWSRCEFNADLNDSVVDMFCTFDPETGQNIRVPEWRKYLSQVSPGGEVSQALTLVWDVRKGGA